MRKQPSRKHTEAILAFIHFNVSEELAEYLGHLIGIEVY